LSDGRIYQRGDIYELDDDATAKMLIESGYAVEIKEPIKAIEPAKPAKHKRTR